MSISNRLDSLSETEAQTPFGKFEEDAIVSLALDDPDFLIPVAKYLKPELFTKLSTRFVIAVVLNYLEKFGEVPTRGILRDKVAAELTEDDPYEEILSLIDRRSNRREVPQVKDLLVKWAKDKAYGMLLSEEAIAAYERGDYGVLRKFMDQAEAISMDGNAEVFGFVNGLDFLEEDLSMEWFIDEVMVADQPFMLGGKKKVLKTGTLCDMIVSLATGTKFLGQFDVPTPRRVAFFSAESGRNDIQVRLRTILRGRSVDKNLIGNIFLSFERPKLSNDEDLLKIAEFVERNKIEVLIVDPLYLTLLTGNSDSSSSNLYDMGGVFAKIANICHKAGATPVLCHHFKKSVQDTELDLDNFSFTGASEFARQSLLVGRRGKYNGPRNNQLLMATHGFGRGQRYSVHIDEGDPGAPTWAVTVEKAEETVARDHTEREEHHALALREFLDAQHVADPKAEITRRKIRLALGWNDNKIQRALERGILLEIIEEYEAGRKTCYRTVGENDG